jgi:hypothetical protein
MQKLNSEHPISILTKNNKADMVVLRKNVKINHISSMSI